jgi:pimeloyl-ACP methyl ester carboxylesterase
MYVSVGDVRLFVDIDGLEWVPDGDTMRRRPTALVLHGGPGLDSAMSKTSSSYLTDIAQVVYFDHRANGRSESGAQETWNLAQWGDDVYALCQALGIEKPVVIGGSFGGFVAMSYAVRHPEHPAALVLISTAARKPQNEMIVDAFRRLGGDEVADIVRRDMEHSTPETSDLFLERAMPFLAQSPDAQAKLAEGAKRSIRRQDVELRFNNGEVNTYDFREALKAVCCPTLLIGGELDPIIPPAAFEELRHCLPLHLVEAHLIEGAGHPVRLDAPEQFDSLVTEFVQRNGAR